eukprot:CAMPEP_0203785918 /NCGR_PEP_ID=MMETSP0100_2-20121128/1304_1 /ASSEMBLY_ACC=CAM_ASM_000210 /TAXON_ID=96639 /ORGANISM=" , Strain NY0313808BC1" /LENGTH=259 /DNA_ID=CAMNT_0050688095 /DNA_START=215 /DNA_END=994 /DNA_ORIENTATION=+
MSGISGFELFIILRDFEIFRNSFTLFDLVKLCCPPCFQQGGKDVVNREVLSWFFSPAFTLRFEEFLAVLRAVTGAQGLELPYTVHTYIVPLAERRFYDTQTVKPRNGVPMELVYSKYLWVIHENKDVLQSFFEKFSDSGGRVDERGIITFCSSFGVSPDRIATEVVMEMFTCSQIQTEDLNFPQFLEFIGRLSLALDVDGSCAAKGFEIFISLANETDIEGSFDSSASSQHRAPNVCDLELLDNGMVSVLWNNDERLTK